jgi:hypothetical protein
MEDALTRLHRAIEYAVLASATGSADQRGALYTRIAQALTTQGRVNDTDAMAHLPNFEALRAVLPVLTTTGDGRRTVHPVWDSPDFVAPAVAALAILYDRMLDPHGDSRLCLRVSRQPDALYGWRLEDLSAAGFRYAEDGTRHDAPMERKDWMHVSIILSGAALGFMKEASLMRFAPHYLHKHATGTVSPDRERQPPVNRPRPFIVVT